MEKKARRLFVLSLILGLLTAFLIYFQLQQIKSEHTRPEVLVPVLVAAQKISAPGKIRVDMLEVKEIPPQWRHEEAATAPDEVIDLWASRDFAPGEQILKSLLVAGERGDALAYLIPAGKRALTIPINIVTGVAGQIRVGDRVDILVTLERELLGTDWDRTITLLQDIEILYLEAEEGSGLDTTATLAVTPEEAEELTLADERGRLRLSLRPAAAGDRIDTQGVITPSLGKERR